VIHACVVCLHLHCCQLSSILGSLKAQWSDCENKIAAPIVEGGRLEFQVFSA
jgi:hypothetical protein